MEPNFAADIVAERRSLADTLAEVGPAAPTLAGRWTAEDIAAHVVSLDRFGGVATFIGRTVVAQGVRLNDAASRFADTSIRATRRRGFAWVLEQLRSSPPRLLLGQRVAPIGLFEVFVHHEDVRRASARWPRRTAPAGLAAAVPWLLRYQRRVLPRVSLKVRTGDMHFTTGSGPEVVLAGPISEVALWLAGRRDSADVELEGDEVAVKEMSDSRIRI